VLCWECEGTGGEVYLCMGRDQRTKQRENTNVVLESCNHEVVTVKGLLSCGDQD
jgi:hypothetical protein